jgi:hypothetical protein
MIKVILELVSFFEEFRECFLVKLAHQFLLLFGLFELVLDLVNLCYLKNFMVDYFDFLLKYLEDFFKAIQLMLFIDYLNLIFLFVYY